MTKSMAALLGLFIVCGVLGAQEEAAGPRTIAVSEIRAGMRGYGLTVVKGSEPRRFEVEVLGVLVNIMPQRDAILIRAEGLDSFVMLEDDLSENKYRWDTSTAPDGEYWFKVTASDAASNVEATALTGSKVEGPFTVDNTGPVLSEVAVEGAVGGRRLTVEATDAASPLAEAFSSVDGGKWEPVLPEDGIFDSRSERISVWVTKEDAAIVVIRTADRAGNTSVAKAILKGER